MKLFVPASRSTGILLLVLCLPFLLFGLFMLLAAVLLSVTEWRFLGRAEHTTGTIERFSSEVRTSGNSQTTYYKPVYTFSDRAGRKSTVTPDEEERGKPAYEVGQSVPVLYDPAEPGKSHFDTFSSSWGTALGCGGLGVVLTVPSLWLLAGCIRGLRRKTGNAVPSRPVEVAPGVPAIPPGPSVPVHRRLQYPRVDLFFSGLVVVMITGAVWVGAREKWYLARAGHTPGKVVSVISYLQQVKGSSGYMKYRPTLSFKDDAGKTWTFDSGRYGLEGRTVGAILPVVYDPADPGNAQIESFWGEWDPTFTFAYVAVFAVLLRWIFRHATVPEAVSPRDPAILEGP